MSTYKPTGYPPGRPRKGEIRPVSPQAVKQAEWRANNLEKDREYKRNYVNKWNAENRERAREIWRNAKKRQRQWQSQPLNREAFATLAS